jgi:hypothetical protein
LSGEQVNEGPREEKQFRWVTIWLMPIPLVLIVAMVVTLALMQFISTEMLDVIVGLTSVIVYVATSVGLRRAIPDIERVRRGKSDTGKG